MSGCTSVECVLCPDPAPSVPADTKCPECGPLVPVHGDGGYVHEFCGDFANGVYEVSKKYWFVGRALSCASNQRCAYSGCRDRSPTIRCAVHQCPVRYHFVCAAYAGATRVDEGFKIFCPDHADCAPTRPQTAGMEVNVASDRVDIDHATICFRCGNVGNLVLCDTCPKAVHLACAGLCELPVEFRCGVCTGDISDASPMRSVSRLESTCSPARFSKASESPTVREHHTTSLSATLSPSCTPSRFQVHATPLGLSKETEEKIDKNQSISIASSEDIPKRNLTRVADRSQDSSRKKCLPSLPVEEQHVPFVDTESADRGLVSNDIRNRGRQDSGDRLEEAEVGRVVGSQNESRASRKKRASQKTEPVSAKRRRSVRGKPTRSAVAGGFEWSTWGSKRVSALNGASTNLRPVTDKLVLCSTKLNDDQRDILRAVSVAKKTQLRDDVDDKVTHVVLSVCNAEDTPIRTIKLCKAIAAGVKLVLFSWVEKAVESADWPDPEQFLHPLSSSTKLFLNTTFYFGALGTMRTKKADLIAIVKIGGGNVLSKKPGSDCVHSGKLYLVEDGGVSAEHASRKRGSLKSLAESITGAEIVEPCWILNRCLLVKG